MSVQFGLKTTLIVPGGETSRPAHRTPVKLVGLHDVVDELAIDPSAMRERNRALGLEALEYVQNLHLESNTYWQARLAQKQSEAGGEKDGQSGIFRATSQAKSDPRLAKEVEALKNTVRHSNLRGLRFRQQLMSKPTRTLDEFVSRLTALALGMQFANCTEQAVLAAQYLMDRKGVDNFAIVGLDMVPRSRMDEYRQKMKNKNYLSLPGQNHTFLVLGLSNDADLSDPDTWGSQAVLVDPWADYCGPVREGLAHIQRFFLSDADDALILSSWIQDLDLPFADTQSFYDWNNQQRHRKAGILLVDGSGSAPCPRLMLTG